MPDIVEVTVPSTVTGTGTVTHIVEAGYTLPALPVLVGTAVLSGGTKVVSTSLVTAASRILLTSQTDGGTPGWLRVSGRSAGVSFTITSSSGTDASTVAYAIY